MIRRVQTQCGRLWSRNKMSFPVLTLSIIMLGLEFGELFHTLSSSQYFSILKRRKENLRYSLYSYKHIVAYGFEVSLFTFVLNVKKL